MVRDFRKSPNQPNEMALTICNSISLHSGVSITYAVNLKSRSSENAISSILGIKKHAVFVAFKNLSGRCCCCCPTGGGRPPVTGFY